MMQPCTKNQCRPMMKSSSHSALHPEKLGRLSPPSVPMEELFDLRKEPPITINGSTGSTTKKKKTKTSGMPSVSSSLSLAESLCLSTTSSITCSTASKFIGTPNSVRTQGRHALRLGLGNKNNTNNNSTSRLKPPVFPFSTTVRRSSHPRPSTSETSFTTSRTRSSSMSFSSIPSSLSLPSNSNWAFSSSSISPIGGRRTLHPLAAATTSAAIINDATAIVQIRIAQRSSSKEVKAILTQLAETNSSSKLTPEQEQQIQHQCAILAQLAMDSYYKVVMAKFGGAQIVCHVLRCFPTNASIQESACAILQHMPHAPYLLQTKEQQDGSNGIQVVLQAMDHHPDSIHVQSAACQALWAMIQAQPQEEQQAAPTSVWMTELVDQASHMYLTPAGRQSVQSLQALWNSNQTSQQDK